MGDNETRRKLSWNGLVGGMVTGVTLVGGVLGIWLGVVPWIQTRHNVDGTWTLRTRIERSALAEYKGLELTYTINLIQDGARISGKGQKLGEKLAGKTYQEYEPKDRTDVDIDGNLDGDSFDAIVTDHGRKRETSSHFQWKLKGKSWEGTFISEAAQSSGKCSLTRVKR